MEMESLGLSHRPRMRNPLNSCPPDRMDELAEALAKLRDAWVNLSMLIREQITESDSPERDAVLTEVERYLCRLRDSGRKL